MFLKASHQKKTKNLSFYSNKCLALSGLLSLLSICLAPFAKAMIVPPAAPFVDELFGIETRPYTLIRVGPEGYSLSSQAVLKADRVVIEGVIETNGFPLFIDTRKLEFKPGGKIQGFSACAPENLTVPAPAAAGSRGRDWKDLPRRRVPITIFDPDESIAFFQDIERLQTLIACHDEIPEGLKDLICFLGRGENGGAGTGGQEGEPGFKGCQRSNNAITVFAAEVTGLPIIDGVGQNGGKGGRGGQGGAGGNGGQGKKGSANWLPFTRNEDPGQGGNSGLRGWGGPGGQGGSGGPALPLIFLTSQPLDSLQMHQVYSRPGSGGPGGDPGEVGGRGCGGLGGQEDSSGALVFHSSVGGGNRGESLEGIAPATSGRGSIQGMMGCDGVNCGEGHPILRIYRHPEETSPCPNTIIKSYSHVESKRREVIQNWFAFHWMRNLKLIIQNSLEVVDLQDLNQLGTGTDPFSEGTRAAAIEVGGHWETHFIHPIQNLKQKAGEALNLERLLAIAKPLQEAFLRVAQNEDRQRILEQLERADRNLNELFQSKWKTALEGCVQYNRLFSGHLNELGGFSSHFEVPVCINPKGLLKLDNLQMPIETILPLAGRIPPEGIQRIEIFPPHRNSFRAQLLQQAEQLFTVLSGWLFVPAAYATQNQTLFYHGYDYTPEEMRQKIMNFSNSNDFKNQLLPEGEQSNIYLPLQSKNIKANLPAYLRILSILAGAKE